jgi:hypothetical protein
VSAQSQKRRFDCGPVTSGRPPTPDISLHCANRRDVPEAELSLLDGRRTFLSEASRPTDANKRFIRIGNCEFIHSPRLVFWSASSRTQVLYRGGQTIDIFKIQIKSERISSRHQPAFLRAGQMEMSPCAVRQYSIIGISGFRSTLKSEAVVETFRRIEIVAWQDSDKRSG